MAKRWAALLWLGALAGAASGQPEPGEDFVEMAPPKVSVFLEQNTVEADAEPAVRAEEDKDPIEKKIEAVVRSMDQPPGEETGADSANASPDRDDFSPASALLNGLMALCAVLALFFFLVYLGKRFGKRTPLLAGQQLGQVMGRVALSPQATLHFVRTNGEVLVVGVTQHSVNLLRTFDAADFEAAGDRDRAPEKPAAPERSFLEQLRQTQQSMPALTPGVDEDLDSLKGDLQRLQQYIQDSARGRE